MIKTTLHHILTDMCIDVAFKALIKNFKVSTRPVLPVVGGSYAHISHIYADEHYYECFVHSIEKRMNTANEPYNLVYISYSGYGGSDLSNLHDEMDEYYEDEDTMITEEEANELFDDGDVEFIDYGDAMAVNADVYRFYE